MKRLLVSFGLVAGLGVVGCAPNPPQFTCNDSPRSTFGVLRSALAGSTARCEQLPEDNSVPFVLRCNGSGCVHPRRARPITRVCIGESCYRMPEASEQPIRVFCDTECRAFREGGAQPVRLACDGACQRTRASILKSVAYVPARAVTAMVREARGVIGF